MYDAKTAHRWRNWDGVYFADETDDWDWMMTIGTDKEITTGEHQQYHAKRIENAERREYAQKDKRRYTNEQMRDDEYSDTFAEIGKDRTKERGRYHRWTKKEIERLGKISDAKIAEIMGLKVQTVRMRRRDLKIPAYKEE